MGDTNPIRTLGDYSKPSHEGYRNTIELSKGTMWYLFDPTSSGWERTRLRLFQFSIRDQARNWLERLLASSISIWEDLTTNFLAHFFPPRRTVKLRNDILMFQQHQGESLSEAWTRFKDLLQKVPHHGIDPAANSALRAPKNLEKSLRNSPSMTMRAGMTQRTLSNWADTEMPAEKENEDENGTKTNRSKELRGKKQWRGPVYEAIIKKKITRKENIGGNFEIPCNIGGIAEYVLVDVARYVYPVDFMILNIREDKKRPFILGTPFMTTTKAVIKFNKGTITLRSGKSKISFHMIPKSLRNVKKGIKNDTEPIAPTMTVNRLVLEWEERIKLHQKKEMEFDQWRSKNFKNKHPTLVEVKGEKNEEEVT
nr:hypothetical protein [Tanacetum cinerariifolium]